jgi:hypothetical protein
MPVCGNIVRKRVSKRRVYEDAHMVAQMKQMKGKRLEGLYGLVEKNRGLRGVTRERSYAYIKRESNRIGSLFSARKI